MTTHSFELPTGHLTLELADGLQPGDFLRVAARRNNPKRGFLFVSTLLGKHLPVRLTALAATHAQLAARIPPHLGDTLVVGMAETATLLGWGVWAALTRLAAPCRTWFLQTTRHPAAGARWAFEEAHSHAPEQWIQGLGHPALARVRRVVLVDDELSTGATFLALEAVLRRALPVLERVDWACLTDFRSEERRHTQPARVASLLEGTWSFEPRVDAQRLSQAAAPQAPDALDHPVPAPPCRPLALGRTIPWTHPGEAEALVRQPSLSSVRGRTLVLGTGECMPLPYLLAQHLDQAAERNVWFQATTRSPAHLEGLSLGPDAYGEGVPQFLYHYNRRDWETVLLAGEGPLNARTQETARLLGATPVVFGGG